MATNLNGVLVLAGVEGREILGKDLEELEVRWAATSSAAVRTDRRKRGGVGVHHCWNKRDG